MLKKLRNKIEKERDSKNFFCKSLVFGKDLIWWCIFGWPQILRIIKLRKIDSARVARSPNEIRLFMVVRNESLRLPYIFKYYSKMGVDRFFVVDNGSTDGTLSFLLSQNNTHVFTTNENYKKANCGSEWTNIHLKRYGIGHWCLVIDADEIFIYPHYEKVSIRDLCNFLDKEGSTALNSLALDIYSNKPIRLAKYRKGENPLLTCPYFDKDIHLTPGGPLQEYSNTFVYDGGVRQRVFGAETCLNKLPLFKFKPEISLSMGHHFIIGANLSDIEGCVLHFKYTSDFISRVLEESKRGEHFNNAIGYKKYAKKIKEDPNINLYYSGSVKFKDSNQLVDLKIMKTSNRFEAFVKNFKTMKC